MTNRILFILLVLSCCQCASPATECRYGEPQPIFSGDSEGITTYTFSQNGQESSEVFTLAAGKEVEIYQSGCDDIRQEYRFSSLRNATIPVADSIWVQEAAAGFLSLSEIASDPVLFGQYSMALAQNASSFPIGEIVQLDAGFFIGVNFVPLGQVAVIQVILQSAPPENN